MKYCKDCEHLKIEKPDEMNEGHAYCGKYNVSTMLIGKSAYKRKIEKLRCYEEVGEADVKEVSYD